MSPVQQAALAQIRAMRAAKPPVATIAPTAPAAAPVLVRQAVRMPTPGQLGTGAPERIRPRGSLLNIEV
jgi:hypothetical protein